MIRQSDGWLRSWPITFNPWTTMNPSTSINPPNSAAKGSGYDRGETEIGRGNFGSEQRSNGVNALTLHVEDYFQVEAFANVIARDDSEKHPRRVDRNTERLLEILG